MGIDACDVKVSAISIRIYNAQHNMAERVLKRDDNDDYQSMISAVVV